MRIVRILFGLALMASIAWFVVSPDFEPAISVVTSLVAVIVAFRREKTTEPQPTQSQTIAEGGTGIQAGGDIQVGSIHSERR
jgi:hypothetical protein